ncbi:MAG: MaoC family dehydratase [Planctomycetota bacterium]|jgi:3-hydroxybutyryl-CoA dehydratase
MSKEVKKATRMNYSDIQEGSIYTFEKVISREDIITFAKLTGDFNPLHVDKEYGEKSKFKNNIVHGMLAGSLFSTLVGMYCPGEKNLYLSQTLMFRKPILPEKKVIVRGTVNNKDDNLKIVTLKTEIIFDGTVAIHGVAKVSILGD